MCNSLDHFWFLFVLWWFMTWPGITACQPKWTDLQIATPFVNKSVEVPEWQTTTKTMYFTVKSHKSSRLCTEYWPRYKIGQLGEILKLSTYTTAMRVRIETDLGYLQGKIGHKRFGRFSMNTSLLPSRLLFRTQIWCQNDHKLSYLDTLSKFSCAGLPCHLRW